MTTKKSNAEAVPKTSRGVSEMLDTVPDNGNAKDIPLTETEILKIENFELKMNSLRQSVAAMQGEYQRYLEGLHSKYELQPGQQLAIDPRSGVARAMERTS